MTSANRNKLEYYQKWNFTFSTEWTQHPDVGTGLPWASRDPCIVKIESHFRLESITQQQFLLTTSPCIQLSDFKRKKPQWHWLMERPGYTGGSGKHLVIFDRQDVSYSDGIWSLFMKLCEWHSITVIFILASQLV